MQVETQSADLQQVKVRCASLLQAAEFRTMLTEGNKKQAIKAEAYYFVLGRSMPSVEQFVQGI